MPEKTKQETFRARLKMLGGKSLVDAYDEIHPSESKETPQQEGLGGPDPGDENPQKNEGAGIAPPASGEGGGIFPPGTPPQPPVDPPKDGGDA